MAEQKNRRVRRLYEWEIQEFTPIFGISLAYRRVRVHECASWPDWIDRLGRKLKRLPPPREYEHNAITLGNHCYFPVSLPEYLPGIEDSDAYKVDWLVHELTHAMQYQHLGWRYIYLALVAQFRDKERAYDYGGEQGLMKSRTENKIFKDFNPEQQGNITQDYYRRIRAKLEVEAWRPFIQDLNNWFLA